MPTCVTNALLLTPVIQFSLALFIVNLYPVVAADNLTILDFSNKDVLEP